MELTRPSWATCDFTVALFLIISICLTTSVSGATIYDESVNGDLPGIPGDEEFVIFEFEFGKSVIRGMGIFDYGTFLENGEFEYSEDPADGFVFIVPPGKKARVVLSEEINGLLPTESATWVWELRDERDSFDLCYGRLMAYNISGTVEPNTELPTKFEDIEISAGEYCIYYNFRFLDAEDSQEDGVYMDYMFEIFVTDSIDSFSIPFRTNGTYILALMLLIALIYSESRKPISNADNSSTLVQTSRAQYFSRERGLK